MKTVSAKSNKGDVVATGPTAGAARSGELTPATPNLSLHPDPDTYFEQQQEYTRLLSRIRQSTSSVVGIAGVRGAGKSSLAQRILKENEAGGFTLNIPSPTSYDPREFIVALFQRICEATIEHIDRKHGTLRSLELQGRREADRVAHRDRTLAILAVTAVIIVGPRCYLFLSQSAQTDADKMMRKEARGQLRQATELQVEFEKRGKAAVAKGTPMAVSEYQDLEDARRLVRTLKPLLAEGATVSPEQVYETGLTARRLGEGAADKRLVERWRRTHQLLEEYRPRRLQVDEALQRWPTPMGAALAIMALLADGLLFWKRTHRDPFTWARSNPRDRSLRNLATETIEYLQFQATLKATNEAAVSGWNVTAKLGRAQDLQARPLSMPGLMARFNVFLDHMSDVVPGRCIICIDELDKIADPQQLADLLRGIKGILGHGRSHFILTVSEDVLSQFSTRRRVDRNILESSFDEIVHLERVNLTGAEAIIGAMLGVKSIQGSSLERIVAIVWLFSGGIPREIKRSVVACKIGDASFPASVPLQVWKELYLSLIASMRSWALTLSAGELEVFHFLRRLDAVEKHTRDCESGGDIEGWFDDLSGLLLTPGPRELPAASGDVNAAACPFRAAQMEAAVAGLGAWVAAGHTINDAALKDLRLVFSSLAHNQAYARVRFLAALRALELPVPRFDFPLAAGQTRPPQPPEGAPDHSFQKARAAE
ncbi:MAG: hypothetical protein K0Q72_63 [Armatimonadetes bacterium]|jgi:hypothetical protein|nr:hypothetical protein [Armatimonadota bacterium]